MNPNKLYKRFAAASPPSLYLITVVPFGTDLKKSRQLKGFLSVLKTKFSTSFSKNSENFFAGGVVFIKSFFPLMLLADLFSEANLA